LPGSALLRLAEDIGLTTIPEAFADRGYTAQATLVPRTEPGALLHDPADISARMVRMVTTGRLRSVDGADIAVSARSICVHGDSPGAVAMAVALRRSLIEAGMDIRAFAPC
jgi:5-oxoprolinase (ATP-hydrolysing) subunit A